MAQYVNPFLRGVMSTRGANDQSTAQEIGILSRLAQMQQQQAAAERQARLDPLQMDLLRAKIAEANAAAPLKALEVEDLTRRRQAQGALTGLLATGGGPLRADAVAMNDADALRQVQEAEARGQTMTVNVPNPGNVRALTAMAFPDAYAKAQFREPKTEPVSPVMRMIQDRDRLPPDHPARAALDAAIAKAGSVSPGTVVNVNPNGPLLPGKSGANKIDENLLDVGMRLQGLSAIEKQFKPEFQQIGTRLGTAWNAGLDKMGVNLPEADRKQLVEFSQYKRNAIDMLNQYIKSITGAAMSVEEAQRILRGLPNPGTGIIDGDSPTEFKAKMDDAIKQSRMAEARFVYMKRNGMALGDLPLDRMPALMNQRGSELEATIRRLQPQLPEAEMRKMVRRNLAQEFGLVE